MPESQYVKAEAETTGGVLAAQILLEKVTDRDCAAVMNDLIEAARHASWRIALDLSRVMLLASAGLGALINLHKQCQTGGGKLVVFGMRDEITELMKLTKLNRLLNIADTRDAAIKKASA
jgi:anti-sigma B factor antagonist